MRSIISIHSYKKFNKKDICILTNLSGLDIMCAVMQLSSEVIDLSVRFLVLLLISIFTYRKKYLDGKGVFAAFIIGVLIIYTGGWVFFILLFIFMIVGSILTKIVRKKSVDWVSYFNSNGLRSWKNVLANGFWPMYSAIIYSIYPDTHKMYAMFFFLGSLTSMMSDTVSTEVGMYLGGAPVLITNPKVHVPKGFSGGVTLIGLLGGLMSAILFSYLSAILFGLSSIYDVYTLILAGFIGSIIDSILGATVQAKYRCKLCGSVIETRYHCGEEAELVKGFEPIDNHVVNFISSLAGGVLAVIFYSLLH
ncbi:hypothetical protein DRN84_00915 [Candidatus Geothermarchaeota archaeon]|nr:MAG: hypothetical protein DRN84_00915 [Candidatus Geothermarchaeota archaeon]HEW94245.1 DUF92 domain-containing protein [Thermoprotei archaeon]